MHYPSYKKALSYSNRNRLTGHQQQANNRQYDRRYQYDVTGNLLSQTDANQQQTSHTYDRHDRLISSIDANQGKTTYRYDNRDNLLQVEDPQGRQTRYRYDKNNRLQTEIKQTGTGTTQRRYHYDANGNRSRIINPGEEKTEHHYDAANRLIRTTLYSHKATAHPVKVIDYHYNNHDQYSGYSQTPGSDSDNATADIQRLSETRRYNNLNQLTSVSINTGHFEKTTRYSYRPNGLKNSYTSPEGKTYRYIYNKNNRLIAVIIPGKGTLSYINHRWLAPQTIKYPGGSQQNITIDDLQRPGEKPTGQRPIPLRQRKQPHPDHHRTERK
uniref:hypothetical protein n=1 Tax=Candidatus Vondammii sp. HM_W22 TaxID=2687299 RepID=UPI002E7AE461|nr:hypothetical protein [Candidatus Vondammii sp. HM_W22]